MSTYFENSLKIWIDTSLANPIEWLIILVSMLYMINVNGSHFLDFQNLLEDHFSYRTEKQKITFGHVVKSGKDNDSASDSILMVIRIWAILHFYKHAKRLSASLEKTSDSTRKHVFVVVLANILLSFWIVFSIISYFHANFEAIGHLNSALNSVNSGSIITQLCIYFIVSDLEYLTTLTLHAMTSKNRPELGEKIFSAMVKILPRKGITSFLDSLAIGLGIYSKNDILQSIAINGSVALIANFMIFFLFAPAFLSLVLVYPEDFSTNREEKDEPNSKLKVKSVLFKPMAAWYISCRQNFLAREQYNLYCQKNQIFSYKISLKAQILLIFNLCTSILLERIPAISEFIRVFDQKFVETLRHGILEIIFCLCSVLDRSFTN